MESGLITDDILERFPYQEHPDNIALVATMAGYLGVDHEFSLKAMADFLVPDLGVLKTHPIAHVRSRKIEFTNGCSANERFGCMGNWKRLGFDSQDPWNDPCTWITGVVNNRADRVPRSKVFAKIIVQDIHADRFLLIGNNLEGLQGFIKEAWHEHEQELSLRDGTEDWSTPWAIQTLEQSAWNMRQPVNAKQIFQKLKCLLNATIGEAALAKLELVEDSPHTLSPQDLATRLREFEVVAETVQSVEGHYTHWLTALQEYSQMRQRIESAKTNEWESLDDRLSQTPETMVLSKNCGYRRLFRDGRRSHSNVG